SRGRGRRKSSPPPLGPDRPSARMDGLARRSSAYVQIKAGVRPRDLQLRRLPRRGRPPALFAAKVPELKIPAFDHKRKIRKPFDIFRFRKDPPRIRRIYIYTKQFKSTCHDRVAARRNILG